MIPSDIFSLRNKKGLPAPKGVLRTLQAGFESKTLEIFRLQAEGNPVYKNYLKQLGVIPEKIKKIDQIPFLPIEFFKTNKVITKLKTKIPIALGNKSQVFLSSGTTGMERSKHYVSDTSLYEKSFRKCFEIFYGDVMQYAILAFLPSYY